MLFPAFVIEVTPCISPLSAHTLGTALMALAEFVQSPCRPNQRVLVDTSLCSCCNTILNLAQEIHASLHPKHAPVGRAICVRGCYAVRGTDMARATGRTSTGSRLLLSTYAPVLRACYAMSGTDMQPDVRTRSCCRCSNASTTPTSQVQITHTDEEAISSDYLGVFSLWHGLVLMLRSLVVLERMLETLEPVRLRDNMNKLLQIYDPELFAKCAPETEQPNVFE
eukprot:650561-Rhodomonas_salina.8